MCVYMYIVPTEEPSTVCAGRAERQGPVEVSKMAIDSLVGTTLSLRPQ